jgi:hypothetical protein
MSEEFFISLRGRIILAVLVLVFIAFIFSLLKKRKISETLGLIWLVASVGVLIFISHGDIMIALTHLLGAKYAASALTMLGLLFITSLLLYFTLKISSLTQKVNELTQHVAIREYEDQQRFEKLEGTETQIRTAGKREEEGAGNK